MGRDTGIYVTDDLFRVIFPVLFACRIAGLCPFVYKQEGNKRVLIRWSFKYCIYSYVLAVSLVSLTIFGMINDMKKGDDSIRMKDHKGRYITVCDISIVALTVSASIFLVPFTFMEFCRAVDFFNQIDLIISLPKIKEDKKRGVGLLCIIILIYIYIISFDITIWNRSSTENNHFIKNYGSFYGLYIIAIIQELFYAQLLLCIWRRYKILNESLQKLHRNGEREKHFGISLMNNFVQETKLLNVVEKPHRKQLMLNDVILSPAGEIKKLATIHELIGKSVLHVNSCYGLSLLLIVTSCLLHLIVTPFFFLRGLSQNDNHVFSSLQLSWIVIHVLRLLLIVEPCHACLTENQKTTLLVCNLLRKCKKEEDKQQLEAFAMQLYFCRIEFSSCGLFSINRSLITAIAGAVTTYLVILLQFNDNDST